MHKAFVDSFFYIHYLQYQYVVKCTNVWYTNEREEDKIGYINRV